MVQKLQAAQKPDEQESNSNKREQSTVAFPYHDLKDGTAVAQAVYDHKGYASCSRDELSVWLKHGSATSGTFRERVSTARLFGLIETSPNAVKLTQLGLNIVDSDTSKVRAAHLQAFLNVPLYSKLYDHLKSRTLPNNIGLEEEMVELGVTRKQKAKARQAFQRSADQAGFLDESSSRLIMPSGLALNNEGTPYEKNTNLHDKQQYDQGGSGGGSGSGGTQKLLDHPLVQGLFQDLARTDIPWTQAQHDEWLELAKLVLKRIHPIIQQGADQ